MTFEEIEHQCYLEDLDTLPWEFPDPQAPISEDAIESYVEQYVNAADKAFMSSVNLSQEDYDRFMKQLNEWADYQYERII